MHLRRNARGPASTRGKEVFTTGSNYRFKMVDQQALPLTALAITAVSVDPVVRNGWY